MISISSQKGVNEKISIDISNLNNLKTGFENDINQTIEYGVTILHLAVHNGNLTLVKRLIENGSNVNQKTDDGTTPLYIALRNNNYNMINLLINYGATIC